MKTKEFKLPKYIGVRNLEPLFEFCTEVASSNGDVVIDARAVTFIDPMGLTVLTALLSPMCQTRKVDMVWLDVRIASYLQRMNFFNHCPVGRVEIPNHSRSDLKKSLVELTLVNSAHETDATAMRLATALTGCMTGLSPQPVDFHAPVGDFDRYNHPIQYALNELLDNSLTHARRMGRASASVWVAAQYYSEDTVRIGVADNGCGFLATLSNHIQLTHKTHAAAIALALEPFVSCNRDMGPFAMSENQGVGLTTTRRISEKAGGGMTIVSGNAKVSTGGDAQQFKSDAFWSGVAISFVCKRDLLPQIVPSDLLPDLPPSQAPGPALRFTD